MWQEHNNKLYCKFEFKDFKTAFAFMARVAEQAEAAKHHPTWLNTYNVVEVWLTTHDAGNTITQKDWDLAKMIDNIMEGS